LTNTNVKEESRMSNHIRSRARPPVEAVPDLERRRAGIAAVFLESRPKATPAAKPVERELTLEEAA
jgi:hypothetical protein